MTQTVVDHSSSLYPWLKKSFTELTQHPIPNSLLIYGEKDIGKLQFGLELANYLLCESPLQRPCHSCDPCHWTEQGSHPDLFIITPQNLKHLLPFDTTDGEENPESDDKKQSKFIRIEQIRQVISKNELGSYRGGKRVVLIYPVEAMQSEAANCLLKTLEEPSSQLHFILITNHLERILPTIRSRCQFFSIPKPPHEMASDWLKHQLPAKFTQEMIHQKLALYAGSPLRVVQSIDNKILDELVIVNELAKFHLLQSGGIIDQLNQHTLFDILNCIYKWSIDVNFVAFGLPTRYFPSFEKKMQSHTRHISPIAIQEFISHLRDDLRLANHPLFPKVQLETLLMKYKQLFQ